MIEFPLSLLPFHAPAPPRIAVTAAILRRENVLSLNYILTGNIEGIRFSSRSAQPGRKDELWKATCFECFLAIKDQPTYWEINLSPSGDWNVYRMDAYRRVGFREEGAVRHIEVTIAVEAGSFRLRATIDLAPLFRWDEALEASLAAVLLDNDGSETYWALKHAAPQADFHMRETFILALAGQTEPSRPSGPGD
jgi:hypothetical protein